MIRLFLFLYNLVLPPVFLAMLPSAVAKARRRGGFSGTLPARFGFPSHRLLERISTGRIWIHAVSVGEVGIALKFCAGYRERNPEARFLLTTTTPTALAIASEASSDWLEAMPNPVDLPIVTSRLMRLLSPSALLMVEADLWPNRIAAAKAAGIPVALLNARLSTRSERRFRLVKPFSAALFGQLDLITLTDPSDPDRWHSLGLDPRIIQLGFHLGGGCAIGKFAPFDVVADFHGPQANRLHQRDELCQRLTGCAGSVHGKGNRHGASLYKAGFSGKVNEVGPLEPKPLASCAAKAVAT